MNQELNNVPASQMVRVPTTLIPAVKELSRLHRQGLTTHLLEELQSLISRFDSSVELKIPDSNELLKQVVATLGNFEQKLGAIETRLGRLELRQSKKGRSNQGYSPDPGQTVEVKATEKENLARRLGVDVKTLVRYQEQSSPEELEKWSRHKDPARYGWRFHQDDGLFHPVKEI